MSNNNWVIIIHTEGIHYYLVKCPKIKFQDITTFLSSRKIGGLDTRTLKKDKFLCTIPFTRWPSTDFCLIISKYLKLTYYIDIFDLAAWGCENNSSFTWNYAKNIIFGLISLSVLAPYCTLQCLINEVPNSRGLEISWKFNKQGVKIRAEVN